MTDWFLGKNRRSAIVGFGSDVRRCEGCLTSTDVVPLLRQSKGNGARLAATSEPHLIALSAKLARTTQQIVMLIGPSQSRQGSTIYDEPLWETSERLVRHVAEP